MARPRPRLRPAPHGSALLLALVLLGVLTVIGAAAVLLSSQERLNASSATKVEFLNACANAAQAKIWAEMSQYGLGYLGSAVQVTATTLPDGTKVMAPAHYGHIDAATAPLVSNVTFRAQSSASENILNERDCTNAACGLTPLGQTYGMTAVCKDAAGREFEIELAVKFGL
jgi:hypothetical protein